MKNPILVTGATGTLGREVVRYLAERGTHVRAMVRDIRRANFGNLEGVEIIQGDMRDPEDVRMVVDGVEKIFLLTPIVKDMDEIAKVVIEMAVKAGVRKVVYQSLIHCDAEPHTVFGMEYRKCERLLEKSPMGFTFLRPNLFMQNFIAFQGKDIRQNGTIKKPSGEGRTSYIDIRDVAATAAVVLDGNWYGNKVFTLTGPESLTNTDVANELTRMLGRKIVYEDVTEDVAKASMEGSGLDKWMIDGMMGIYKMEKTGKVADVTKGVQTIMGKRPRTFKEFVLANKASFNPEE